jgi:hypothetical protein
MKQFYLLICLKYFFIDIKFLKFIFQTKNFWYFLILFDIFWYLRYYSSNELHLYHCLINTIIKWLFINFWWIYNINFKHLNNVSSSNKYSNKYSDLILKSFWLNFMQKNKKHHYYSLRLSFRWILMNL